MSRVDRTIWPLVLVLIFAVGACSASGDDGASETSPESTSATSASDPPPPEIVALIEGYLASWENHDKDALRASVSDDFVINEYIYSADGGTQIEVVNDDADGVVSQGFAYTWQNEVIDDWNVSGDDPWTVRIRELWQLGGEYLDGIATYTVVDEGGTLKIARHSWAGFLWYEF